MSAYVGVLSSSRRSDMVISAPKLRAVEDRGYPSSRPAVALGTISNGTTEAKLRTFGASIKEWGGIVDEAQREERSL